MTFGRSVAPTPKSARQPRSSRPEGDALLPQHRVRAIAVLLLAALAIACPSPARRAAGERASESARPRADAIDPERLHAVLINGGGDRAGNYFSHYVHVREMLGVLDAAGVPAANVVVFASDGADPAPDLAIREVRPEGDGWLLDGTKLAATLGEPIEYVDTELAGHTLEPATREGLERWFEGAGKELGSGDTLLLYVTDHGTRGKEGPLANRISLWGPKESIDVTDLGRLLGELAPGVRVVALMSQCYSGGFGLLAEDRAGAPQSSDYCGYFSSTPDRPAYGCYPENRGADDVGHSVRFIEALFAGEGFPESHQHTLASDHTPDVPLRTTDVVLYERLHAAAARKGVDVADYADTLLVEAWRDKQDFEADIRLLDRIGQSYGFASPRSLEEIDQQLAKIGEVRAAIDEHADAWGESRGDLARANLGRFLAAEPEWNGRLAGERRDLDAQAARALGDELLASLGPFTHADRETDRRLRSLRERSETAAEVAYRMAVREAALLRMEAILFRVAGQVELRTHGSSAEQSAYEGIERCENLALPVRGTAPLPPPEPFPAYATDVALAETVLPGWMGIQFRPTEDALRSRLGLAAGAVRVQRVYPDSPAERAHIEAGDVIVGPRDHPFMEPRQIREWTMLAAIDEPQTLEVLHDGERVFRDLVPGAHPGRFPELPAPPRVGAAAPALEIERYRGEVPKSLADGRSHLLFFWATWCAPCKAALPELMDFARERGVDVVAVTDEDKGQLDGFFASFQEPFPVNVAVDSDRDAFLSYGVSGTPTFVLIDGAGRIVHYGTGYNATRGLALPGWTRHAG